MSLDMATGWYVRGHDGSAEWQKGPYAWAEIAAFARDGRLKPHNPVWHASMADWAEARTVPGLFGQPGAAAPAAPAVQVAPPVPQPVQPPAAPPAAPQQIAPPQATYAAAPPAVAPPQQAAPQQPPPAASQPPVPRTKRGALIAIVAALVVVLAVGAFAGWWFLLRDGAAGAGPSLGVTDTTVPESESLIATDEWGEVPANHLLMMMTEGSNRSDAEKAAESFGGSVVGEVEFISLYQVQFDSTTEAELRAAVESAEAAEGVEYAYPVTQVTMDAEIWGVRLDPYADPVYGGAAGDGYKAVGVSKAWTYIKGSGVDLGNVRVGVVDSGLYAPGEGAESEFGGKVKVEFPDPDAGKAAGPQVYGDGTTNAAGTHGTGVATVIGADPDNGGPSGVAGPLGDKLTVSMLNMFTGKYGDTTSTPDPNDPTKQVWHDGKTYSIGSLVAITQQIKSGATVINCSWGNSNADPKDVETFTRFFTKMAADHPDVLFVCSGGNGGQEMDGSKRYPSGLALPNMVTVGALDNDGKKAEYADWASDDYEITLSAPGTNAIVGLNSAGGAVQQDGSSFAAPHVTAAAAILKSLNPKLTAAQIKQLLVETARDGVPTTSTDPLATSNLVPPEMGGKILAVDLAVLKVINDLREAKGLAPFDEETLEQLGVVDAVAVTGAAGEYQVRGIVGATGEKGARITIEVYGENSAIGGKTEQELSGAGEVEWAVTLPEDKGVIKITRLDSGAASLITIEDIDINGHWDGTFTFTQINVDPEVESAEGCSAALLQGLVGTPMPMTLDLTVDETGNGSGTLFINMAAVMEDGESEPQAVTVTKVGGSVSLGLEGGVTMPATVGRSGDSFVMNGTLSYSGEGYSIAGAFSLSKPAP